MKSVKIGNIDKSIIDDEIKNMSSFFIKIFIIPQIIPKTIPIPTDVKAFAIKLLAKKLPLKNISDKIIIETIEIIEDTKE